METLGFQGLSPQLSFAMEMYSQHLNYCLAYFYS